MSILLAIAATMGGTTFECRASTANLTIFAPSAQATANHRGNVLTLYKVSGDGEVIAPDMRISQVFDDLPYSLFVSLEGAEFDVELEISNYDEQAGTTALRLTATSTTGEKQTVQGNCTATPGEQGTAS